MHERQMNVVPPTYRPPTGTRNMTAINLILKYVHGIFKICPLKASTFNLETLKQYLYLAMKMSLNKV